MILKKMLAIIAIISSSGCFAAVAPGPSGVVPTASTVITSTNRTVFILCPVMKIGGNSDLNRNQVKNNFAPAGCQDLYNGGGGAIAGGTIGAGFTPNCPADHPYLGGTTEGWGGGLLSYGAVGMTVRCCTTPQPPMSLRMTWIQTPADGRCP